MTYKTYKEIKETHKKNKQMEENGKLRSALCEASGRSATLAPCGCRAGRGELMMRSAEVRSEVRLSDAEGPD